MPAIRFPGHPKEDRRLLKQANLPIRIRRLYNREKSLHNRGRGGDIKDRTDNPKLIAKISNAQYRVALYCTETRAGTNPAVSRYLCLLQFGIKSIKYALLCHYFDESFLERIIHVLLYFLTIDWNLSSQDGGKYTYYHKYHRTLSINLYVFLTVNSMKIK